MPPITWSRFGGYECSSKGDSRFSAFTARLADGRTIEEHYQCDVKGYDPGGTNWRLGKGKLPLDPTVNLWDRYLALWREWATTHADLIEHLAAVGTQYGSLSDRFATTPVNQAHALATLANEWIDARQSPTPPVK